MNKAELIGQIIDIFEDELEERNKGFIHLKPTEDHNGNCRIVPLYQEDEDCNGVFYGGYYYDKVSEKIEETLKEWGLLKYDEVQSKYNLYVVETTCYGKPAYCVSTSPDEAYCDEEIWLQLGISEERFYTISRKCNPTYYYHTFDYGSDFEKEVCDTEFLVSSDAFRFMENLLKEVNHE